jgi:hypothetical protein
MYVAREVGAGKTFSQRGSEEVISTKLAESGKLMDLWQFLHSENLGRYEAHTEGGGRCLGNSRRGR